MNTRSSAWLLTINYYEKEPTDDEQLQSYLKNIKDIQYYIGQLEQGESGTIHHQIYIIFKKRKYFTYLKELFPSAHIEMRRGSHQQAKEYCSKPDTRKALTFEWGEQTEQGKRTDLSDILEMIYEGSTINDIINTYPSQYLRYKNNIESLFQQIHGEQVSKQFRNLTVTYVSGKTGVGKTSTIMKHYGFENVYRVTDYKNPFDTYQGQEVIIFDEYHSQFRIEFLLNLLDGYPLKLPARYNDKIAKYKTVYIISNEPITKQYKNVQSTNPDTYQAILRRINYIFDDIKKLQIHLSLPF